jgi:hypothetical protein
VSLGRFAGEPPKDTLARCVLQLQQRRRNFFHVFFGEFSAHPGKSSDH